MRVDIQSVTKRYGAVSALCEVDLNVEEGELFFLLGPSGCGKTTLLRILAGFEAPDSGRILFDAVDVTRLRPEQRNSGMVFQNYALWPHLTVHQNVSFGLEVRKLSSAERERRVHGALSTVRMEGYEQRKPNQLSGGQQQRVALARALVIHPELVLLDEPLSNLDARLRLEMRSEIRDIIKRLGHTAVYVTHDQKEALAMADRCAILHDGRVEQIGTTRELYERPINRFVAEFLGEANLIRCKVIEKADSRVGVQLAGTDQVWHGISSQPLSVGMQVYCCVRPEAWRFGDPPSENLNRVRGDLLSSTYLGEVTQHRIALKAGETQQILSLELHHPPREKGSVSLWAMPEDTIIMT